MFSSKSMIYLDLYVAGLVRKVIPYKSGDFEPVMERISTHTLIRGACQFRGSGPLSCSAIQIGGHAGGTGTNVHCVHSAPTNPSRMDRSHEVLKRGELLTTLPPPSCLLRQHRRPLLRPPLPSCRLLHRLKVSLSNP
jgi:hypothetical protein